MSVEIAKIITDVDQKNISDIIIQVGQLIK